MNRQDDQELFANMKEGDQKAFEALFRSYYPGLCQYATRLLNDAQMAEETVQELFVRLWEKRSRNVIETSVKNYLFRSVKNQCLNYIKHNQIKLAYAQKVLAEAETSSSEDHEAEAELIRKIEESIASLPDKRREIFRLNRQEGLKYREIAEKLNISVKTVETQMGLALKSLREKLRDFLLLF